MRGLVAVAGDFDDRHRQAIGQQGISLAHLLGHCQRVIHRRQAHQIGPVGWRQFVLRMRVEHLLLATNVRAGVCHVFTQPSREHPPLRAFQRGHAAAGQVSGNLRIVQLALGMFMHQRAHVFLESWQALGDTFKQLILAGMVEIILVTQQIVHGLHQHRARLLRVGLQDRLLQVDFAEHPGQAGMVQTQRAHERFLGCRLDFAGSHLEPSVVNA